MAYSHAEFLDWYMSRDPEDIHFWLDLAFTRWQEAAPLNPAGDRFAAMVRQVGQVGASASHQIGCALASLPCGSSEDVFIYWVRLCHTHREEVVGKRGAASAAQQGGAASAAEQSRPGFLPRVHYPQH